MSNNLDITIYDFEDICRTCLSREELKPLYEKCFPSTSFADMLMSCTFIKFIADDGLPAKICTNCIHEINQAFSFAKHCETTDTFLRKCVKKFETELANNSSQTAGIIIKTEEEIDVKPEIILPEGVEEVKDYEFVEVKQEEDVEIENDDDDPADESYEEDDDEDQDETFSEKSDDPDCSPRRRSTNPQMQEDGSPKPKPLYYECKKCFEKFTYFKDLKKHREEVKHPPKAYNPSPCSICNKMIEYRNKKQHMRTHTGEKPCCCDICGASFSQGSSLSRHKRVRHSEPNDPTYQCQNCGKSFKRLDLLKAHQRRERKANQILSRDFQCTECDRAFTTKRLLRQHLEIHGEKKFWCGVCERGFVRKILLVYHSKVHTDIRPYVCQECGKAFSQVGSLRSHKLIHTGVKANVCSVCSKAFTHPTTLKYHMRKHTGEKPHICGVCNKSFSQPTHLKNHKRMHTGDKPYTCEVCDKSFAMNSHLKRHKKTHTQ